MIPDRLPRLLLPYSSFDFRDRSPPAAFAEVLLLYSPEDVRGFLDWYSVLMPVWALIFSRSDLLFYQTLSFSVDALLPAS